MSFLSDVSERLRALFRARKADVELDDELRFHLELEVEQRVRRGQDPATARREALAGFGGVERIKDDVREARGVQPLEDLWSDLRFSVRTLAHKPSFTLAAVLVLGLGIGAATAAFTVYDAVLLKPLPYPHPERLIRIYEQNSPTNRFNIGTVDFQSIRDRQRSFEAFGAQAAMPMALSGSSAGPVQIMARRVTSGWFKAYGVTPLHGRLIEEADESLGAPAVVVVSYALAEQRLGGADRAIGKAIMLDGLSHQVVGVLAPGMERQIGLQAAVWPALRMPVPTRRGPFWMQGIARLREGVTLDDAARDLAAISTSLIGKHADWHDAVAKLTPYRLTDILTGQVGGRLGLFAAAVALVLLVAIANVATLVLVRASAREQELSVRAALGASRRRVAGLLLTENLVLVAVSGLLGVLLAVLSMRLVSVLSPTLPRLAEVGVGVRALLFAAAATAASGVLVSLSPVWGVLAGRGSSSLRADARSGAGRSTNLVRGALVIAEFALALPLLLGAGLLLNSFIRLQQLDRGYNPAGAVSVSLSLPPARYPGDSVPGVWDRLEVRLRELPGVTSIGLSTSVPPDEAGGEDNFNLVDKPVAEGESEHLALWSYVTPGFFEALGVPLLEGHHFVRADTMPVVLVSKAWADRYYPRESAVGKQLVQGGCYSCPRTTVIGVVGNLKYAGTEMDPQDVYGPLWQGGPRSVHIIARGSIGEPLLLRRVSEAVAAMDAELPRTEATLTSRLDASLADPGRWTAVIGSFGTVAMLLAALGIFGLMSYVVRQRRRELGVRLALGADPASLTRLIVVRGMKFAAVGIAIGLGLAVLEARWLGALLFGVAALDPVTLIASAVLLALTGLLASLIPGLHAARIRPLEVLSSD